MAPIGAQMPRLKLRAKSKRPSGSAGPDEETIVLEDLARADFTRRRRAERWRKVRLWLLALAALLLVGSVSWLFLFSPYLVVKRVEVEGLAGLSKGRVIKAAEVPMGRPLARLKTKEIETRVEVLPPIESAVVSRDWPDGVRIKVAMRQPVAVIEMGKGLQAFDSHGVLFGSFASRPPVLPMVQAKEGTEKLALSEAAKVIRALPADLAAKIDYVRVGSVDEITLVLGNGRSVLWGSATDSQQKAEVLAVLLKQPGSRLDVSIPSQPTIK